MSSGSSTQGNDEVGGPQIAKCKMLLLLLSVASAENYFQTTTGELFGQANPNGRNVCMNADVPSMCGGVVSSSTVMPNAGFTSGSCAAMYSVTCSGAEFSFDVPTCGTMSASVHATTNTDCELWDTSAVSNYYFMPDSAWGQSTGIVSGAVTDFCTNALLPDSCAGTDMTSTYADTLGAVAGSCDGAYNVACDGVGNSNVVNGMGVCGSATISVLFKSQSDCDAATSNAAAAASNAAAAANSAADGCADADTFGDTPLTCQQARENLGCGQAAVMMACRSTCNVEDCGSSASALTIALATLTALVFAF